MSDINPGLFLITITTLILSIAVHEWAHAISADWLGDDTPRSQGRVTLWPPAHLDPLGTVLMVISTLIGFGIGWGKPVMTQPANYRRMGMRAGDSFVAFAGPLSNLIIAAVFAMPLRFDWLGFDPFWEICALVIVQVNLSLFCFNLLPIYPLDGSHLLLNSLSGPTAESVRRFQVQYGGFLFLLLAMTGVLGPVLRPMIDTLFGFLVGA